MKQQFTKFVENIRLTQAQEDDAKSKYTGVCKKLHDFYYKTDYDGKTKFLFGSYKTKTITRPITEDQDVDVLFKIPYETYKKFYDYESNGPSALLQEVKKLLDEKYTTTERISAWGKVVFVKFPYNHHNVEVLPAYEKGDLTYIIPNSENGGSWEEFDPRKQVNEFQTSNIDSKGLTADLIRMIKTWRDNTPTLKYKSFQVVVDVINFLKVQNYKDVDYSDYQNVVKDFFVYLKKQCDSGMTSFVQSALERAIKAIAFYNEKKPKEASEEWRKIFGRDGKSEFPVVTENPVNDNRARIFTKPAAPYASY